MADTAYNLQWGQEEQELIEGAAHCPLSRYDFSEAPSLDRDLFMQFMSGERVEAGENGIMFGGPGTGKTHLGYALAGAVAGLNKTVRLVNGDGMYFDDLVTEDVDFGKLSRNEYTSEELSQFPRLRPDLLHCDLLVVNEFPRMLFGSRSSKLAQILKARYAAKRSTFIMSRMTPQQVILSDLLRDHTAFQPMRTGWVGRLTRGFTARLFLELNIGLYVAPDSYESQVLLDRIRLPMDQRLAALARDLHLVRPSWIVDPELLAALNLEPGLEWNLFYMDQPSYRRILDARAADSPTVA